ncbi:lysine--tRNA ligase [Salinispira pacifica]|uniref:Lysine--tRNA ligase n=1 Tax=Salinispira pacifica TaxID=1307761 RepID=V5WKC2_9SPIO|nr:lysine--tRNA ligase [Salinispira pacifica]AHC16203.1 Lysyl-tRNA synthetase (class I) [Salinispira pacifica]
MAKFHENLSHWADQNAQRITGSRKNEDGSPREQYTCASGITPSGTVHIGNFREIITVDLVHRALLDRGVNSRFIYSWDDYDVFRKIPKNMPRQEELEKYLRWPIVDAPDPWAKESSYARAMETAVESVLPKLGIRPDYIYQAEKYRHSDYAEGIRKALEHRREIMDILNEHRTTPLADDWWPVSVFSSFTHKDTTRVLSWDGEWSIRYLCEESGKEETLDLRTSSNVKLPWRIDWPMRWNYEHVDFEPAGKEHHSAGGSFDTAKRISKAVYDFDAPVSFKYDFISIKGQGGKISSSLGNVVSIEDVLKVYQPEIVRYLFAGTRPNAEFSISFDLDVIKIYEDYDRCERIYFGEEEANEKRQAKEGRIYELSQLDPRAVSRKESRREGKGGLLQIPFRHLCNLLLIHNGDIETAVQAFPGIQEAVSDGRMSEEDLQDALVRAQCAWNWIQEYAPEDFRFSVNPGGERVLELDDSQTSGVSALVALLEKGIGGLEDKELQDEIYSIARTAGIEPKDFFTLLYRLVISKEKGPRLAGFLKTLGEDRVLSILRPYTAS